jgi:hypothetical protein
VGARGKAAAGRKPAWARAAGRGEQEASLSARGKAAASSRPASARGKAAASKRPAWARTGGGRMDQLDNPIGAGGAESESSDADFTVWAFYAVHGLALGSSWMVLIPVTALLVRHFRYERIGCCGCAAALV